MDVLVQAFGPTRNHLGADKIVVRLAENARVSDVVALLEQRDTELAALLTHCAIAVGDEIVPRSHELRADDEVALLPPVAGG